jgi:hypothetical protein
MTMKSRAWFATHTEMRANFFYVMAAITLRMCSVLGSTQCLQVHGSATLANKTLKFSHKTTAQRQIDGEESGDR